LSDALQPPPMAWEPAAYKTFLEHVLTHVAPRPFATVAAGHAASYALSAAATVPGSLGSLCLVAPTWRGPLPTMMPGRRAAGAWITRASDLPVFGALLYRLNVNAPVVRMMARGTFIATRIGSWQNGSSKRWLLPVLPEHAMPRSALSPGCWT
jgi:hypothetical protein